MYSTKIVNFLNLCNESLKAPAGLIIYNTNCFNLVIEKFTFKKPLKDIYSTIIMIANSMVTAWVCTILSTVCSALPNFQMKDHEFA